MISSNSPFLLLFIRNARVSPWTIPMSPEPNPKQLALPPEMISQAPQARDTVLADSLMLDSPLRSIQIVNQ